MLRLYCATVMNVATHILRVILHSFINCITMSANPFSKSSRIECLIQCEIKLKTQYTKLVLSMAKLLLRSCKSPKCDCVVYYRQSIKPNLECKAVKNG